MGKVSKISYVDSSWSPWVGCTKVSEACKFCYAEALETRYGHDFSTLRRASDATFNAPLKWKEPRRIFVCELSDFFHPDADEWREEALGVMERAQQHTYLILTKRPERAFVERLPSSFVDYWLGTTTENQECFDGRVEPLLTLDHSRLWISAEPLLGPINFENTLVDTVYGPHVAHVVVGAESGPNRRECKVEWIEDIVDQCRRAQVPVYVKQGSHLYPGRQGDIPDHLWEIKEMPK